MFRTTRPPGTTPAEMYLINTISGLGAAAVGHSTTNLDAGAD